MLIEDRRVGEGETALESKYRLLVSVDGSGSGQDSVCSWRQESPCVEIGLSRRGKETMQPRARRAGPAGSQAMHWPLQEWRSCEGDICF